MKLFNIIGSTLEVKTHLVLSRSNTDLCYCKIKIVIRLALPPWVFRLPSCNLKYNALVLIGKSEKWVYLKETHTRHCNSEKYIILLRITFNLKLEQPLTAKLIDIFDVKYYVVNFDLSRLFINSWCSVFLCAIILLQYYTIWNHCTSNMQASHDGSLRTSQRWDLWRQISVVQCRSYM